jgi:hypothetical protein
MLWVLCSLPEQLRPGVVNLGPRFRERPPAEVNQELLQASLRLLP